MKTDNMPYCRKTCNVFKNTLEMAEQIKTLQAENERLRAALEEASHMIYGELYPDHPTYLKVEQALQPLKDKEQE